MSGDQEGVFNDTAPQLTLPSQVEAFLRTDAVAEALALLGRPGLNPARIDARSKVGGQDIRRLAHRYEQWLQVSLTQALVHARSGCATQAYTSWMDAGDRHLRLSDAARATHAFREALVWARRASRVDAAAAAMTGLARSHAACGREEDALEYHERALSLQRKYRIGSGETKTLRHLGRLCWEAGRFEQAREIFVQALEGALASGDLLEQGRLECELGSLAEVMDDASTAWPHYKRALRLLQEEQPAGSEHLVSALHGLASLAHESKPRQALRWLGRARGLLEAKPNLSLRTALHVHLGFAHLENGCAQQAATAFTSSARFAIVGRCAVDLAHALGCVGAVSYGNHDLPRARQVLECALRLIPVQAETARTLPLLEFLAEIQSCDGQAVPALTQRLIDLRLRLASFVARRDLLIDMIV